MEKYILFMGLNDKETKTQLVSTLEAYKITMNIIKRYCDGGTVSEALGFYTHENGSVVTENSLRIELLFIDKTTCKSIVDALKVAFNQESIAVQCEVVNSELW